ncbi:TPA: hypothetical protein ACGUPG_004930, partial [Vibrio vulnificus]
ICRLPATSSCLGISRVNPLELICNCEVNYIYRDNNSASLEVIFILFYILNGNLSIILSERRPDRDKSVLIQHNKTPYYIIQAEDIYGRWQK